MPRLSRYPPLPPVSPVQMALISSPPPRPTRPRILSMSPAHARSIILAAARPRYPVSYIALTPTPRPLSLVLKLATAPREPGPVRITPSNRHLLPNPKSPTLSRCPPLSFAKTCSCPISRRCGIWKPSPPMPKFFSSPYPVPRHLPELPRERFHKVMNPEPRPVPAIICSTNLSTSHVLRKRKTTKITSSRTSTSVSTSRLSRRV